jgi:hypothetical protein
MYYRCRPSVKGETLCEQDGDILHQEELRPTFENEFDDAGQTVRKVSVEIAPSQGVLQQTGTNRSAVCVDAERDLHTDASPQRIDPTSRLCG